MLVLTRKLNETVTIGDDIEVSVVEIEGKQIRLGIKAPKDVKVFRSELLLKEKGEIGGKCNRSVCSGTATHYNHSTRKYYCAECAEWLNDMNREEALDLYGHDLCT